MRTMFFSHFIFVLLSLDAFTDGTIQTNSNKCKRYEKEEKDERARERKKNETNLICKLKILECWAKDDVHVAKLYSAKNKWLWMNWNILKLYSIFLSIFSELFSLFPIYGCRLKKIQFNLLIERRALQTIHYRLSLLPSVPLDDNNDDARRRTSVLLLFFLRSSQETFIFHFSSPSVFFILTLKI